MSPKQQDYFPVKCIKCDEIFPGHWRVNDPSKDPWFTICKKCYNGAY